MSSARTEAATRARVTGGQEASLLSLCTRYRDGATILAGTAVLPLVPVRPHPRVALDCRERGCGSTVFGDTEVEASDRLAEHRRRCHG